MADIYKIFLKLEESFELKMNVFSACMHAENIYISCV